jgi:SAM-dependent methyltransferase
LISAFAENNLEGKRLLDVGCGLGILLAHAKSLGMKPTGIDIFVEYGNNCYAMATELLKHYNIPENESKEILRLMDITDNAGSLFNQFDFCTSIGMLEHISGKKTRDVVVQNIFKSLKSGGYMLLVCGPNKYFPVDLHHYGPGFIFYHTFPDSIKKYYLKFFGKPEFGTDPTWLNGIRVSEIKKAIRSADKNAEIIQAFPLLFQIDLKRKWMKNLLINKTIVLLGKFLTLIRTEPVIFIVARHS